MGGAKYTEIHTPIASVPHETGMLREVILLSMLEDEDTVRFQDTFFKDDAGYRRQLFHGIGRIGKDKVKLLFARLDIPEDISADTLNIVFALEFLQALLDEAVMISV